MEGSLTSSPNTTTRRKRLKIGGVFWGKGHEKASIEEEEYVKEMKRRMRLREKSEEAERTQSFSEIPSERFKTISNSVGEMNGRQKNYSFYAERVEDLPQDILERFIIPSRF